jgi:Tol biopolymer transport system component
MSWAPYIHPSGEYLLFASNKLGFENFEVFMVDVAGTKEPVRVTYSDGFDGLPVPSPDGQQIAWTSSRGGGREGQIFLAQWNHEAARKAIAAAPPRK